MQTSDLDHSHETAVGVQPSMGRYLVLFTAIFLALTTINAFLVISQVMTLLSPFLAAYLTGLIFIKKKTTTAKQGPRQNTAPRSNPDLWVVATN